MACSHVFSVSKEFHEANRAAVLDMVEHGGNAIIDYDQFVVDADHVNRGGYNSISMPRGVVDWHSHPQKCQSDEVCAVGLPSPADMVNITLGALHGTQVHLLYAAEGTYVIRLRPEWKAKLQKSKRELKSFCKTVSQDLEKLHQRFTQTSQSYVSYQRAWLASIKHYGFDVQLFPKNERPMFELQYDCSLYGRQKAPIYVYEEMHQMLKAEKKSRRKR